MFVAPPTREHLITFVGYLSIDPEKVFPYCRSIEGSTPKGSIVIKKFVWTNGLVGGKRWKKYSGEAHSFEDRDSRSTVFLDTFHMNIDEQLIPESIRKCSQSLLHLRLID